MRYMKTIVNGIYELKGCWLHENRRYFYEGKNTPLLPITSLEYKPVLDNLGIPYKVIFDQFDVECLMYWDPDYEEYEEKSGPLYFKESYGVYKYTGRSYSQKLPTKKMIQMAVLKELTVKEQISSYKKLLKAKMFLKDNICCFYTSHYLENYSVIWDNEEIRQLSFSFKTNRGTQYGIALFDMAKIRLSKLDIVTLPLSEQYEKYAGLIIGREGFRVKQWCQDLGIKKIVVQ